jgi:hypothetical protein
LGEVDDRQGASSDKLIKLNGTSTFTSFIVTHDGGAEPLPTGHAEVVAISVLTTSTAEAVRPKQVPAEQAPADLLYQPYKLGPLALPHRIVMAPLTRSRARQPGNVPTSLNACYYAQRASAALIISEATQVSMQGQGYAWTPGIHSREQVEGWRLVTDAVHEAGGRIFLQLWHVGRISHPSLQPDNVLPVAPSAITPAGNATGPVRAAAGAPDRGDALYRPANMAVVPGTRWRPISTAWRCTAPTAISSISSSIRAPITVPTPMAGRSSIGRGC